MERSQSCSSFETSHKPKDSLIRNALEFAALQQSNSQQDLSTSPQNLTNLPHFENNNNTCLRRKTFQRQRSATFSDDTDYAGDLEEDDDDDEVMEPENSSRIQPLQLSHSRHRIHYQPTLPSQPEIGYIANVSAQKVSHFSSSVSSLSHQHLQQHQLSQRSKHHFKKEESFDSSSTTENHSLPSSPSFKFAASCLLRDNSVHSDSSRYSSVDSLLEARKPDPEAILINLGFGPVGTDDILSRIPKRFLKPSQVRGNDTEAFVKRLQLASNLADHSALGYRGLTGNPDVPPSSIVAKIMQRFEVNERKKSMGSIEHAI